MEIFYTEITQDLTAGLLEFTRKELDVGRKIYYVVPSSMSFEKEKEILERLSAGSDTAIFDLLVTRFKQLPYYFDKRDRATDKVELGKVGFSMLFRKVLRGFSREELPLYFSMQNASGFLDLLVNLREELLTANLTAEDLPDSPKNRELKKILLAFEGELSQYYANYSEFDEFIERINAGEFDAQLKNSVIVVDGYTHFSAEEETFLTAVEGRVARLLIGTYASQQALSGLGTSVYANAVEMIARFRANFHAEVSALEQNSVNQVYNKLTDLVEQEESFVITDKQIELDERDTQNLEIWESENQRSEIEALAVAIRQKIVEGAAFKDFTVLVGDLAAYEIPVKEIFELYEIPYFYAQEEAMSQHPLIVFFESLYAIKKNNYRTDDVLNLLKSKVYTSVNFNQELVDRFEYYVTRYKIQGRKKFTAVFDEAEVPKVEQIEGLRAQLFGENSPLQEFLTSNTEKTGQIWVKNLQMVLEKGNVVVAINQLYSEAENQSQHQTADKHEQVWKMLLSVLTEFLAVFSEQKMKVLDFLDIILAGLKEAKYRQIPANVDVVNIKDYELVEPRTNRYVYAIGMSQTNFPRVKKNTTLLSDEERAEINAQTSDDQFIEQLNVVNYQKNTFTVLSLINAATEQLVLSMPQIVDNVQDEIAPVIQLFLDHSDGTIKRQIRAASLDETLEHIGNKRAVIAQMGQIERELSLSEDSVSADKATFWSSIFRILTKENADFQHLLIQLDEDIATSNLSADTVNQVYSNGIYASVSSFENFYNCEYQYFLQNTLKLESFENIDLNSKIVGNFFHETFEKLLKIPDLTSENFDEQLTAVLYQVDSEYVRYFEQDALSRFTWTNLEEIVWQTAAVLKNSVSADSVKTLMTESSFGLPQSELGDFVVDDVHLRGRIDRVDQLTDNQALGAIDYKSSAHQFNLSDAYDGLSLQFLTYLDVLKSAFPEQKLWGALYLQFKNNPVNLSEINQLSELGNLLNHDMSYTGLLLSDATSEMDQVDNIAVSKNNIYTEEMFEKLLTINEQHYKNAASRLKEGKISINPIMKRSEGINRSGDVRGCRFCKLKSICRFEANRHMRDYTREIGQQSNKEILESLKEEL